MNARRLKKIEKEIAVIKARIAKIGVVRPGSLTRQYKDPRNRRGAYYQISYTHRMKSKTEYVRSSLLEGIRQQTRDYKELKRMIAKWVALGIEYSRLSMQQRSR
ncbi:hypothetical protein L6Q96_12150 [Candidatus Binatia bacterium]|nr:hypothetical protein [Candidatus Binatia bacterium]